MEHTKLPTLSEAQEKLFELLVQKAVANERCPTNQWLADNGYGYPKNSIAALARLGYVRIAVYSKNWRVVTILVGEHKGKTTTSPPIGSGTPYRTIDSNGDSLGPRITRKLQRLVTLPRAPDW